MEKAEKREVSVVHSMHTLSSMLVVYISYAKPSLCANGFQQQVTSEDMLVDVFMNVPGIAGHHDSTVMTSV